MIEDQVTLPSGALDGMLPMHLRLDTDGLIVHTGPTLSKILDSRDTPAANFFDTFVLRRPRGVATMEGLRAKFGQPLHFQLQADKSVQLKGIAFPGEGSGDTVVNLSFGISIMEAVRRYELTGDDFAATDLAIEMLYLVEAKTVAMEDTRRLNQRLHAARATAEERSRTDELTGLSNRRALEQFLSRITSRLKPFAVLHIDLDYFKKVNDTYGHAAGDLVLRNVSKILEGSVRAEDLVARVGGDEFVVIFQSETSTDILHDIAMRIIAEIEKPIPFGTAECLISASVGISISTQYDEPDSDRMLLDADAATYISKNRGRAQATLFDDASARRSRLVERDDNARN